MPGAAAAFSASTSSAVGRVASSDAPRTKVEIDATVSVATSVAVSNARMSIALDGDKAVPFPAVLELNLDTTADYLSHLWLGAAGTQHDELQGPAKVTYDEPDRFTVVLTPAVDGLQHRVRMRRGFATAIVFIVVNGLLAGMLYSFIRPLVDESSKFAEDLPTYVEEARQGKGPVGEIVLPGDGTPVTRRWPGSLGTISVGDFAGRD